MSTVGPSTDGGAAETTRASNLAGHPRRSLLRYVGRSTVVMCAAALLALAVGFVWFATRIPNDETPLQRDADGIVALTGGASRITDAIELLASGRGRRLLISGANRATNLHEISRLNPEFERWVKCCVDVDRSLNTLGNAIETKRWAQSRGFHSLIVVASNYHMPRALAEIAHQLPDVTLVPFPVVTDRQRAEPWWANAVAARRLLSEYVKYIVARLRMGLTPGTDVATPGSNAARNLARS